MANNTLIQDPETPNLTASTSKNVIINGSHNFQIQGFSTTKGMGVGKYISSDTFWVGGHSWEIQFYPDGYVKVDESGQVHVSCYIALVSDSKNVRAGTYSTQSKTSEDRKLMWGYQSFYKRTELEASQYIKDDCLTIQCTVGIVKTSMDAPKMVVQLSDLRQSYERLLESKEGSDISFEVEGETFYAHKIILSTRSPVFKAQFYGPLKEENTQCIKIKEMHARVFKALLHFIYCDVIPDVGEVLVDLDSEWKAQSITHHLLAAADRYGIQTLRSLCVLRLCENMAIDTVASTLSLAEQHGCFQLKSKCIEFIGLPQNIKAVMQTDGFKDLQESYPSVIAELLGSIVLRVDPIPFSNTLGCGCSSSALRWCLRWFM
ncbi:hypothetical protein RD792_002041 [Penstemon davidsonii]|uniref:Uncharacterized protein n=1 Tax=Penstemon davidsonii TaxID=160366 RepID=A0ABR0DQU7_9LAMI|nr:hypothetical protein RD792_002041 [Penstemon davidsonii]